MEVHALDGDLEPVARLLRAGVAVAIPTDTVYGVACLAASPEACAGLLLRKGRDAGKPSAIVAGSSAALIVDLGLDAPIARAVDRLLPGPLTLVVPNAARRYAWLCGDRPGAIGVRVPVLPEPVAALIERVGPLLLTSANNVGEPAAITVDTVPSWVAAAIDGGPSAGGVPSTVVDLCGPEPVIVRPGPVSLDEIRERLT
jgi:L-threonylcarbamoyladenylate synthase